MKIVNLEERHIEEVVAIHMEALRGDFLPSLGVGFMKALYRGLIASPQTIGYVVLEERKVVGFITGSADSDQLFKGILLREFIPFVFHVGKRALTRPVIIPDIVRTLLYPSLVELEDCTAELISIALAPAYRGRGMGKELVARLETDFLKRGVVRYKVTINKSNEDGNRFYRHLGFSYRATFVLYGKEMNLYVKDWMKSQ